MNVNKIKTVSILIPAYNEENTIIDLLKLVHKVKLEEKKGGDPLSFEDVKEDIFQNQMLQSLAF